MASSTTMNMDELVNQSNVETPMWLEAFLKENFFGPCAFHLRRKNELKKYCISCNMLICDHCVATGFHWHHEILQIYRHLGKDAVSLRDMEKYFGCSQIQTYTRHKRPVISLNPPQLDEFGLNAEESCDVCNRKLNTPELYRYCSLLCKVESVSKNSEPENPVSTPSVEPSSVPSVQVPPRPPQGTQAGLSFRKRSRKGTPHRAPFF